MYALTVAKLIRAPIEPVFDAYTDHAALAGVPGIRSCRLTRPGETEQNGLGAVRELDCGSIRLREEIVGFDRPHRMEYRILTSRPPGEHRLGRVEFVAIPEGTVVTWTTVFAVRLPVIGRFVTPAFGLGFGVAFRLVLRDVGRRAVAMAAGRDGR